MAFTGEVASVAGAAEIAADCCDARIEHLVLVGLLCIRCMKRANCIEYLCCHVAYHTGQTVHCQALDQRFLISCRGGTISLVQVHKVHSSEL